VLLTAVISLCTWLSHR